MRVANLLILPLVLLGSGSALGQEWAPAGFQVTYEYSGSQTRTGWFFNPFLGFWVYDTFTDDVTSPVFTTLFAPQGYPTQVISAHASLTIKARIKWMGPGLPPTRTYCIINSSARATIQGFTNGDVSTSNGLGRVPVRSTGHYMLSETDTGQAFRVVDLQDGEAYVTWNLEMSASATSIPTIPGDVEISATGNLKIVDRSVQLDATATPTIRRGPGGTQVANQRDETGSLRGDVAVPISDNYGTTNAGYYQTTIFRDLVGHWSSGADKIFNEWEMEVPHMRRRDGLFSEIEWLPVHIWFTKTNPSGDYNLDTLLSGTAVGTVKYTATDSVDNFSATAYYYLHYHPEAEKTGEIHKEKWGLGPLHENVDVRDDFLPVTVAGFANSTPNTQATVEFVISGSRTYSFSEKYSWSGSGGFDQVVKLQLGAAYEKNTELRFEVGKTYSFTFTVLPGQTLVLDVVPHGEVDYPILAAYGPYGFIVDVPMTKPEFGYFTYEIRLASSNGGTGGTGGNGGGGGG